MDNGTIQIILAVITLLGTIMTAVVAPYVKSKYTEAKRNEIYRYVDCSSRSRADSQDSRP
jgi:Na+-translocating ferredoxin:NAD+ oxidoreductase RnfG subunit